MALDSFFTSNIELNVTLASQAYYAGNGKPPVNPYQEGTEQWRAWGRARSDAAIAEGQRQYLNQRNNRSV